MAVLEHVRPLVLPLSWLDRRTLVGILLAALAGAIVLTVTRPEPTVPVLVAGSDLPAGTPLSELDVAYRNVASSIGLVEGDSVGELASWTLSVPLAAGEPIAPSLLVAPQIGAAPDAVALTLERSHAVQGQLSRGDTVDILLTTPGDASAQPRTVVVASGVYILDAQMGEAGLDADRVDVVLAVDSKLAVALATARASGTLDLVRVAP